jgi:hypothetical protein
MHGAPRNPATDAQLLGKRKAALAKRRRSASADPLAPIELTGCPQLDVISREHVGACAPALIAANTDSARETRALDGTM